MSESQEKTSTPASKASSVNRIHLSAFFNRCVNVFLNWGVEQRGILPVPECERTDTQFSKIFFLWFNMNFNVLSLSPGTLGPAAFGLCLRDSCLAILFFNLLCCVVPAYLTTWGPKLGLRQMVQARYSFGYYGVIVPCAYNLIVIFGFAVLNCILGGQTLSSVTGGNLSWAVGIVIIAVGSLLISFCGYTVLNWYERLAWVPVLLVFLVALGVGGKHLTNPPPLDRPPVSYILTFGSVLGGTALTYAPVCSDYSVYYHPDVPSWRIFWLSYLGILLPIVTLECLGAAVVIAASSIPVWEAGYTNGNVGGLIGAMLAPTGNFGNFLTVLLALSVVGNVAASLYSISFNMQLLIPALALVPRCVFSVLATAIIIPLSIAGSHRFYDTILNFLGLISYWAGAFSAIILVEHFVFRHNDPALYDLQQWNSPRMLPSGIAALAAGLASFGVVVPCIDQVWFVGPVARITGDIGFEVAFAASAVLYFPFRLLEVWIRQR